MNASQRLGQLLWIFYIGLAHVGACWRVLVRKLKAAF